MDETMPHRIAVALFVLCSSLSGCGQDYSLAPSADSEQITVTVKVPKELIARTMQVMYRSTLCTFTDRSASGIPYERDGYQRTDIEPTRQGQSDLYEAKLPVNGGGSCQWRLSNVTFGVTYGNTSRFGENVSWGAGGGVVVIFDHNNSPRGGADIEVGGDLVIKKDYYPWLGESFMGSYRKDVSLLGEKQNYYLSYQALHAREVYFEPVLHSKFVVRSVGPQEKKKGNYATFTYPDGSVENVARATPRFQKLQAIRVAAESQ